MVEPATILIGVGDGVLADSLRFALELEGFQVRLCDEYSLERELPDGESRGCLVLDQRVFARLEGGARPAPDSMPILLIVGHRTARIAERAKAAGVTKIVETPLLEGTLFDAIKSVLEGSHSPPQRSN